MNFITAEQFKEQPLEIQYEFLKWWSWDSIHICDYDLVQINNQVMLYKDYLKEGCSKDDAFYPLFTEGQLRKFIEDKTNGKVESYYSWDYYTIAIRNTGCGGDDLQYDTEETNLLQAYWKVACSVTREGISNER